MPARPALTLVVVVLLAACSGDPEADETAVLGATTERAGVRTPTPTAAASPEPADPAGAGASSPSPTATPTLTPTATATVAASPTPEVTAGPAGGAASPTPAATDPPEADGPEALASGAGWSMNALLPDADGEGWTEVGGPPPVDREGGSAERLLVRLRHVEAPGDPAGRRASCEAWLEASPGRALRAHGEVLVELLVDGEVIGQDRRALEIVLDPGQHHALPAWDRPLLVHAAEGATAACTVAFTAAG